MRSIIIDVNDYTSSHFNKYVDYPKNNIKCKIKNELDRLPMKNLKEFYRLPLKMKRNSANYL